MDAAKKGHSHAGVQEGGRRPGQLRQRWTGRSDWSGDQIACASPSSPPAPAGTRRSWRGRRPSGGTRSSCFPTKVWSPPSGRRPGCAAGAPSWMRWTRCWPASSRPGSLEQIIFRVDALHRLEDRGVRVLNSPRAIERTVDKFWTSALLEQCGIATPETVVCDSTEEATAAFRAARRRHRQAALRIDGTRNGPGAATRRWHSGSFAPSSRSGACTTSSEPSTTMG